MNRAPDPRRTTVGGLEGGFVGLLALVIALAIVAWLAMSALKGYGLAGKPPPSAASPSAPADPRERARAVEALVVEQSREAARRADSAAEGR